MEILGLYNYLRSFWYFLGDYLYKVFRGFLRKWIFRYDFRRRIVGIGGILIYMWLVVF